MPRPRAGRAASPAKAARGERLFAAEAAYADSMFQSALGDARGSIAALERALAAEPTYAPAILSLGSVEYQRRRPARGRRLFFSLLDLPDETPGLAKVIDEAGDFLIQRGRYVDGLELYRRAAARFPRVAVLHQGLGCCAGHEGRHDEAIAASREALALEPENQRFVNDLGWSLYQAGRVDEALPVLERAVAMNRSDALAAENLRLCACALKARPRAEARRPRRR